MKPVEVFTLNRESVLVPHGQMYIERHYMSFDNGCVSEYDGVEPFKAVVNRVEMPIFRISECMQDELDIEPTTFNQYFAVDPFLMDAIEVKHRDEIDTINHNWLSTVNLIKADYDRLSDKLCSFYQKPWYKRIWCAITNNI